MSKTFKVKQPASRSQSNESENVNEVTKDDEEEEVLMFVEFSDFLDKQLLEGDLEIQLSNLEGKNPTSSVQGIQMTGQHEVNLGTMLMFSDTEATDGRQASFLGCSNNMLRFTVTDVPNPNPTPTPPKASRPPLTFVPKKPQKS